MSKILPLFFLLLFGANKMYGQKLYGGHFDRRNPVGALFDTPFAYRFACTFYTDAAARDALPATLRFRIIRKKDNVVVKEYTANKDADTQAGAIVNDCVAAGAPAKLDYFFVRYNYDMVVTPTEFNDADGYYVVNDPVGPRNPTVNVQSSNVVLYHWFSPLYLFEKPSNPNDGELFSGWVPESYSFVCKNQGRIIVGVAAIPAQTQVNSQTFNLTLKNALPLTDGTLPFQEVAWKAGFSSSNVGVGTIGIVNANPTWGNGSSVSSISINTPGPALGVFSLAFVAEHRRNGVKIAENYREWQVEVTDCIKTVIASGATISEVGNKSALLSATVCTGKQVQLNTEGGFPQNDIYQWYRNNQPIPSANKPELVVSESGAYYATVKKNGACNTEKTTTLNPLFVDCQAGGGNVSIVGGSLQSPFTSPGGGSFVQPWWNNFGFRSDYYIPIADLPKMPASIKATLYRKRDNLKIEEITLRRNAFSEARIFLPRACGTGNDTLQSVGYDTGNFTITAAQYGATNGGYYVVTEPVCCRVNTDNLSRTDTKMVNYAEFNGADQVAWNAVSGKGHLLNVSVPARIETCAGQNVTVNFGVANKQNLSARLAGFAEPITDAAAAQPFVNVGWKTGVTTTNFNGNVTALQLTQNGNTFTLSGIPEKPGVYAYRIKFEGVMDGVVYSSVYSEFRLIVRDCRAPSQPLIFVSKVGKPNEAAPTGMCQDSLVQLNLRNFTKGSTFQWRLNNGDVTAATDSILVVRNNQGGSYTCVARTLNLCPETMTAAPVTIVFFPKPTASVTVGNASGMVCQGGSVKLTAATNAVNAQYRWLRENVLVTGAASATFDAVESGSYTVRVTDSNGCSNLSAPQNVVSNTPPKAEITSNKKAICPNQSTTLSATEGTGFVYAWTRDGQPLANTTNVLSVTQPGNYSVKITATNTCSTTSTPFAVQQANTPTVTITSPGTQLCMGSTLLLTANGSNLKTFQWQRDGQNLPTATQNTLSATQAGNYVVSVTDTNGCSATSSGTALTLVQKITVALDSIPSFCGTAFPPLTLKGTPVGGVYAGNGVTNNQFSPQAAGVGQHTITYSIKGNVDCLNGEAKRVVTITAPPALDLGKDREVFRGSSVTLNGDLGIGYSYQWTPPAGLDNASVAKPIATPDRTTTYTLRATGPNGCLATASVTIQVTQGVYIPDAFTPNNDGENDTWELKGIEEYPEAEVIVFDRWGVAIFHTKGVNQKPFDGYYNGTSLPAGVYAYHIKTKPDGHVYKGMLMLLR